MLADKTIQLLTAYIDGELSARQLRRVQRLLQKSAEARQLLQALTTDSRELQALPAVAAPSELMHRVATRIADLGARPTLPASRPLPVGRPLPLWTSAAIAASALVTVTALSYLFFSARPEQPATIAEHHQTHRPAPPPEEHPGLAELPPKQQQPKVTTATSKKTAPPVREPLMRFSLAQLKTERTQKQLTRALVKENALHLELPCRDVAAAVQKLRKAFQGAGVEMLVEPKAQEKLQQPDDTSFLLYTDDVTVRELQGVLRELGTQDAKVADAAQTFTTVNLDYLFPRQREQLAQHLGMSVSQLAPARKVGDGDEPPQPFKTAIPATDTPKQPMPPSLAPEPSRQALVVTLGGASVAGSAIVQRFTRAHSQPRLNTLQVVIILHKVRQA